MMNVKRIFYPSYRRWYRLHRWIHRRFTARGRFFLVLLFVSVVFGMSTYYSTVFVLLGASIAVTILCVLLTKRSVPDVTVSRILPVQTEVGTPLSYQIRVANTGHSEIRGLLLRELPVDPRPPLRVFLATPEDGEENRNIYDRTMGFYRWMWLIRRAVGARFEKTPIPTIRAGESVSVRMGLTAERRGYIEFSGIELLVPGPFGLFQRCEVHDAPGSVLALPELFPVTVTPESGARSEHEQDIYRSTGPRGEFMFVREYRPGDDIRFLNVPLLAKREDPMVNQYMAEMGAPYDIICDPFTGGDDRTALFEAVVSVAASIQRALLRSYSSAGLLVNGTAVEDYRMAGEPEIMERYALLQRPEDADFGTMTRTVRDAAARFTHVVFITAAWNAERAGLIHEIEETGVRCSVIVLSEDGTEEPPADIDPASLTGLFDYRTVKHELRTIA